MYRRTRLELAGWAGLAAGAAFVALGVMPGVMPGDLSSMMRGYGAMLALSAIWLLGGLAVRSAFTRRRAPVAPARGALRESR